MKLLVTFISIIFATSALACTDFSGTYRRHFDGIVYSIEQTDCLSIKMRTDKGTRILVVGEGYQVSDETPLTTVLSVPEFINDTLTFASKVVYKFTFPAQTPVEQIVTRTYTVNTLDGDGNLVYHSIHYNALDQVVREFTLTDTKL